MNCPYVQFKLGIEPVLRGGKRIAFLSVFLAGTLFSHCIESYFRHQLR